jgi:enoyl-CoA hydratase/carnithine racemase
MPSALGPDGIDLELTFGATGEPARPLVVLPFDEWTDRPAEWIATAAEAVRRALPLTVGVLRRRPPDTRLAPLLAAATFTLTPPDNPDTAGELIHLPDLDEGLTNLRTAVAHSPRAALACGRLLRQAERLGTDEGLAAEAAVYSMLLSGPEFARWLNDRGDVPTPPVPSAPLVLLERTGGGLSIALNHPDRRNAISFAMREELLAALEVAELDPSVTEVCIHGSGPAFCSGGDLAEFGTSTDPTTAYLVRLARAPWRIVDRLAERVTVRTHGACIGAGVEMAAFAGRVTAAPSAYFALPEVGMGLVPGAGGTVSVTRRIGRWRAGWLMLTGKRLDVATALRWGLVDAAE